MSQAALLRAALDRQSRSAYQLTKDLGLAKATLYNVLAGRDTFGEPATVAAVADALDLDPDELYTSAGKLAPDMIAWLSERPERVRAIRHEIEGN